MKINELLEKYLEEDEDIIGKIYNSDLYFAEYQPKSEEYLEISKSVREQEKKLISNKGFSEYLEMRNEKESIEVEEQFKLGFKTAIKLIMESVTSK